MNDKYSKIHESTLYEIWKRQSYKNPLKTSSGEDITILDVGVHNEETGGPDFKNARIRIGNLTYVGDIEIDNDYTDWKTHGHNIDNKYNKVVLHASLVNRNNYGYVYTRDGRKVPSICFSEFIDVSNLENIKRETDEQKTESISNIKCSTGIKRVPDDFKKKFLQQLGIARFEKKCKKIYDRLKELQFIKEMNIKEPVLGYDLTTSLQERKFKHSDFGSKIVWQQLLYELVFEALGYSKNKSQMMNLAQSVNVDFLGKIESDGVLVEKYESALFFVSGLIREPSAAADIATKTYVEKISLHWNSINSLYDGKYFEEAYWHFFRLRPQNFPTVRLAGGARILKELLHNNLIPLLAKKITEIHNLTVLINSLRSVFVIRSDGFWKNHYIFDQTANTEIKYFVGAGRADEIVVNVVFPFFSVYFDIFGKHELSKKIVKLYSMYQQHSENQIINEVAQALDVSDQANTTVLAQGMIELFRNYCSRNKCLECEIGKVVFD
ncbi:hypothetical protein C0389_04085 [bacterium]|nr:hypothetical protein [bacterium]